MHTPIHPVRRTAGAHLSEPPHSSSFRSPCPSESNIVQTHVANVSGPFSSGRKIPFLEEERHSEHQFCTSSDAHDNVNNGYPWSRSSLSAGPKDCDVYIGLCGGDRSLLRFVKWLRAELEMHGIQCFVVDRSSCSDSRTHILARESMKSAVLGVVIITKNTFSSFYGMGEIKLFLDRSNLVPIFFGLRQKDCCVRDIKEREGVLWENYAGSLWESYKGFEHEWRECVDQLSHLECVLEASASNLRDSVLDTVVLVGKMLGKKDIVEHVKNWKESSAKVEHPFPHNNNFVGRKRELQELELILFGYIREDDALNVSAIRRHRRGLLTSKTVNKLSLVRKEKPRASTKQKNFDSKAELKDGCHEERTYHFLGQSNSESTARAMHGRGIACVCGDPGIGKTELLLEFTYKFFQSYKIVLWIGGETEYFRMNYLKLQSILGIGAWNGSKDFAEDKRPRSFKDVEEQAIRRVHKEFSRDIPYLLVIDNLESEKDWWDGRNLMEVLPFHGGESHIIISTRIPKLMMLQPMRLSYLSCEESLTLIKGCSEDLPLEEIAALKISKEKLGRLPLSLAIFGALLSEIPIKPRKLLDAIEGMPHGDLTWNDEEDHVLKKYPFIVQLLNFCFHIFEISDKYGNLASKMVEASGWFAPSAIPIHLLSNAASEIIQVNQYIHLLKKSLYAIKSKNILSLLKQPEVEATNIMVRLRIARPSTKNDCICFHEIIRDYGRKRGGSNAAHAMVHAISHEGSLYLYPEHIWAASFLLFKFNSKPPIVCLSVSELVVFISRFVIPLAWDTFSNSSRCEAASELLFVSQELLEHMENTCILGENNDAKGCLCMQPLKNNPTIQFDHHMYKEFALLRAVILETRSEMMLRGGHYDIAERLYRSSMNIKEVLYGCGYYKTNPSGEFMERIRRMQLNL